MGRFTSLLVGVVLFVGFFCASIPVAIWLGSIGGVFARSNKLWIYCDIENTAPLSVYVWEPARSGSDNHIRIDGSAESILINRETGNATIGMGGSTVAIDWSPASLQAFALRCGCPAEVVTTEAGVELFSAIEKIRREGRSAMHYKSDVINWHDDRNVPSMTHWEANGPGDRWVPIGWRMTLLVVLWGCCQFGAMYGISRLVRTVNRKLSAHSDAQTPSPGS